MEAALCALVLAFTIPGWWPIFVGHRVSVVSLMPVLLLTFSSFAQVTFLVLLEKNIVTMDYSFKFAALGLPVCGLSIVLAARRNRIVSDLPRGCLTCSIIGLAMWMFLISFH
jgi:hypothetical protein